MNKKWCKAVSLNSFQIIALSFAGVILVGALLLMLPVSSAKGIAAPFLDALFTSVTSVCVTGLVVHDTGTYWSLFGQGVILVLIQIGGLGVITVAASFALISGRRIGLFQRCTMQEAVAAPKISGIVKLTWFILRVTFAVELTGALFMAPVFIRDFGWARGIWMAVFHSVSAFCNAGIDLMGIRGAYSSMTGYQGNAVINLTLAGLIIVGGIGFLTWDDIRSHGRHIRNYRMQSKVILASTAVLITLPAVFFFLFEFEHLSLENRILASLFQAVTPRTAGFNTADLTAMSEPGQLLTIILMLIGGSPGSTAGGMKTTTVVVLAACAGMIFRRRDSVHFFGRRIAAEVIFSAAALAFLYLGLSMGGAVIISMCEELPMLTCLYETASAIGTVGLSLGITPKLGTASRWILMLFMYIGRVGGLTLIYAALTPKKAQMGKLPLEKITVG